MGNVTAKTSGEIASFMTPAKTNIKSLKVYFSPKQLGTGDPSPENVREIVGWDGVEVNGSGKNLLQADDPLNPMNNYYKRTSINPVVYSESEQAFTVRKTIEDIGNVGICEANHARVNATKSDDSRLFIAPKNATYTFSIEYKNVGANYGLRFYKVIDGNTTRLGDIHGDADEEWHTRSFTVELNKGDSFKLFIYPQIYWRNMQIEIANTATNYEPYQGNTISYQWKLPDEYQEVEWVKSDGNQFIQLPFGFDDTDEIDTVFSIGSESRDKYIVAPKKWNNNKNRFGLGRHVIQGTSTNTYTVAFGAVTTGFTYLEPATTPDMDLHKWTYKNRVFTMPELGLSRDVSTTEWGGTTDNLKLFYGYNANTVGSISYYKHIKSDVSYHLVACYRKSDGEIGLYDIVNNVFYTNQGTGTFIKGEDVDKAFYGGYVDLISGELVEDMAYGQVTSEWLSSRESGYIGYTSSITALDGASGVWVRNAFNSTARERKSGGIKANCNAFKVLMNSTGVSSSQNRTAFAVDSSITNVSDFISAVETLEQNGNGLYLAYELAEPITHQLTPTQLKSFVGQNNFWSNADYVEIEYDLIETIDIQKARQKIVMNQPKLKTISNKIVSFNTDMVAPIKNCKIYFNLIQLGTGDPSSTNVRNINGWTGIDSYVNGDKISVDWTNDAGTVYGGYLDLAKGEVVAEKDCITSYNGEILTGEWISDRDIYTVGGTPTIGAKVVYTLSEPIHYPLLSLTSQQLLTLKSTNHIWSETNGQQIDVKYWTHKNLTPIPLTDYLENQTWTDSAYISSSGKKTTNTVSASHFLTNQILLEAGTYVLSGFSYYVGTDNTNFRIHAYDSTGKWLRQITFQQIGNLSPVDITFTLDTDTYVNVSIAMDFDGVLAKIN